MSDAKKIEARRLAQFLARLDQKRQEMDLSERATAVRAGLSPSQIRTMRRQLLEGKQHGVSIRTVARLANALNTTPEWLISGTVGAEKSESLGDPKSRSGLPLGGVVAAGVWIEDGANNDEAQFTCVPADPRYPRQYQSAYEVRGNSTDLFARAGDFLIVVDREASGLPLRSGDIVIVTQHKQGLREATARRYRATDGGGCELEFDSTDSRHCRWVGLPNDEGKVGVQLGGIVVGAYRPL
jgi:SOS-response transcriptional repressor LexA